MRAPSCARWPKRAPLIYISSDSPAVAAMNYVMADRQRLAQILLNLLSNAIKYNFAGGEIEVSWSATNANCTNANCTENSDYITISVRDSNPGIAPENLPRLFVPFERGAAMNSDIEGTGLGLALTRSLIEAMGGEISVESAPGRGSTFSFDLPRALAPDMHGSQVFLSNCKAPR